MCGAWANLLAWRRRRPGLAALGVLAVLAALSYAGYRAGWHLHARAHLRRAHAALGQHDWAEARGHLQQCLRTWPDRPEVRLLAARAARRLEYLNEAEEHLDAAARLLPEDSPPLRVERALLRVYRGELPAVEAFLRQRLADDDPDTIEILDVLSAALILRYRVAEASLLLDDLLRRQPDHFHALARRGWTARSAGTDSYAEAVGFFDRALALRPDADTIRLMLAEMLVAIGRLPEARGHFEELLRRQPGHPSARFGLARCLAGTGRPDEARALFDALIKEHPEDWKARGERGALALEAGRPADAEPDLREAAAAAPLDLPIQMRLAQCLRALKKHDEARQVQAVADQLRADFARAQRLGGLIREARPDDPDLRHELAALLLKLGKAEDAVHWFRSALEKAPNHRPSHEALAKYFEAAGQYDQAAVHREALRRLAPKR